MHALARPAVALALAVVGSLPAACGWADVTLHIHHKLVSGDTVTRANYYASNRMRATAPDGREYIFLAKEKRVTVIDHLAKLYWEGSMAKADSVIDSLNAMNFQETMAKVTDEQRAAWPGVLQSINDSLVVRDTQKKREIAGISCVRWTMMAGSWMTHERWIANDLQVGNYTPEIQRILLSSVRHPLAKGFAKFLIEEIQTPGLPIAASTTYRTLATSGSYSWETFQIATEAIPDSLWAVPADYRRWEWSDRKPR